MPSGDRLLLRGAFATLTKLPRREDSRNGLPHRFPSGHFQDQQSSEETFMAHPDRPWTAFYGPDVRMEIEAPSYRNLPDLGVLKQDAL